jgi:hypothetical protein
MGERERKDRHSWHQSACAGLFCLFVFLFGRVPGVVSYRRGFIRDNRSRGAHTLEVMEIIRCALTAHN